MTLINCFTTKCFDRFPSPGSNFVAFTALSNGFGQFAIKLGIERLDHLERKLEQATNVMFLDRLAEARRVLRVQNVSFPATGIYSAAISIDGEVVADTRFEIKKKE